MKTKEESKSPEYFLDKNAMSGDFKNWEELKACITKSMHEFSDQETLPLREQLKEKEEEIANWKLEAHGYLNNLNNLKAEVEPLIEAATLKFESQSKLIESLTTEIAELRKQLTWIKDRHPDNNEIVLLHYNNCGQKEYACAYFFNNKYYWGAADVEIVSDLEKDFIGWLPIPQINNK